MSKNFNFEWTRTLFTVLFLSGTIGLFGQPANDDPCNAIQLDINTSCVTSNYTNNLATATTGVTAPGCANYLGGDVWFSFTMPNNGFHGLIEMGAAGILDGGMAVYSGTDCNTLTLISCDDNSGTGSMPSITVDDGCSFELAGATIWVRIWENGNDNNGTFDICVQAIRPPVPPGATGCGSYSPASNTCCDAVILNESLNGYCGNTAGYTDNPDEISGFCAFIDNNSWIAFVADETSIALDFTSFNCEGAKGIQVDIFESPDCVNFNSVSEGCFNIGSEGTGTLTATSLTIGNVYYVMVDGWAGDSCDYSISVTGIDPVEVTVSDDDICQGESVQLQASIIGVGPYTYSWSPAGSLDDATIPNPIATPNTTTTYTLTVTGGNLSSNVFTIPITVHPGTPSTPTVSGLSTVCDNATGVIYTATAPDATDYLWTATGGGTIVGSNTDPSVSVDWTGSGGDVCLIASNGCGTSPQACFAVIMGTEPDISAVDPATVCAPNTIDLATDVMVTDANGIPGSFSYYTDQTSAEAGAPALPSSVVTSSGTYWIRKESSSACYDVTSVNITIEDPNLFIDDSALNTCEPGSLNLSFATITETTGLFGTKTFYATNTDAMNASNPLGSTTVTVGGTYWVRFQTSSGCFAVAPINAAIVPKPDITIIPPAPICTGATLDLTTVAYTNAAPSAVIVTSSFYPFPALAEIGGLGSISPIVGAGCYYIRVETAEGCYDTAEICVTESMPPTASISGGGTICSGDNIDITFNLTGNGPFDVVYFDGTNQSLTGISDGHIETLSLTANTDFSLVSVQDANACPGTVSGTVVSAIVSPAPTATISGSANICMGTSTDLVFNFTGSGPFSIDLFDDTNMTTTSLNGLTDGATYTVNPGSNTNYSITTVTDATSCTGTGSGLAAINIVNTPQIINVVENCDLMTGTYTVAFDITDGDPASYAVSPLTGTLTGNSFVSDPIASGVAYSFDVSDVNSCGTDNVSGSLLCECSTDAGSMDLTLIEHCENELGIAIHNNDENLNPGDLLQYVLHDGSGTSLGFVFNQGNVPEFSIETGMLIGTTYYISAIAGPDDGTGMVDTIHPCFSISQGTPVVFHSLPVATISGDATICSGTPTNLVINFTQGTPPFDVVIFDGTNLTSTTLEDINDGHIFPVTPTANTVYTITSVLDNTPASCIGSATGSATIDIITSPVAGMMDFHCNATNTAYQVSFAITGGDPSTYSVTGGAGTLDNMANSFTSDWINSGTGFNFTLSDINNCAPATISGNFACNCTTDAGAMNSSPIILCEDQLMVAMHDGNETLDGDDVMGFVLHEGPGIVLEDVHFTNSTPTFGYNAPLDYGTTYYISAVVANDDGTGFPVLDSNLDPCISVAPGQPVIFEQIPEASLMGDATICEGDSVLISFNIFGTGPFNVEYTDNTNNYVLTDIEDGHTIKLSPSIFTSYSLVSVANAYGVGCMGTIHPVDFEAEIDVISEPKVNNLSVDCNPTGTAFVISFDIVDGNPAAYVVDGDLGTLSGASFVSNSYPTGSTYNFMVYDGTGCDTIFLTSTEYCNCTPDIRPNISIVSGISCNGETDGVLKVDNVNGQAPFEFEWNNGTEGTLNSDLATAWYFVTMTDGNNCNSVDSIFLSEPSQISASLEAQGVSCYGDDNGQIIFDNVSGGAGGYTFTLNDLTSANNSFNNLEGGNYSAGIVDAEGCTWESEIIVEEPAELVVNFGEDIHLQLGDSVQLQAFVNQVIDTFYWETIGELSCTDCLTPFAKPMNSTPYKITVISAEGCVDTDVIWIHINKERPVFIPSAFSPNGDGSNDMFMIYGGVGIVKIKNLNIFNRWGDMVYKAENFRPGDEAYGWDGNFKSKKLNTGVYVYYLEILFEDGTTELFRGDITLMR